MPSTMVYYYYDADAKLSSNSMDQRLAQGNHGSPDVSYYVERGDKVGAFLAQRSMIPQQGMTCPAYASSEAHIHQTMAKEPAYEAPPELHKSSPEPNLRHQYVPENESYYSPAQPGGLQDYQSTIGYVDFAARSGKHIPYPDPEDIRHLHTLFSLLPYIQPKRKLNSLNGQTMDIIEQDTGTVFAFHVPKKLLMAFLGRKVVTKFVKTIEREDNENWRGAPVTQILNIPRGVGSKAAFRILVSWMIRACQYKTEGCMRQFRVPQNTLVACTLSQILTLFGLHRDALRVDHGIASEHFARPIFPVELEALWNCLGENNRYVYAAIKIVGQRLRVYEIGSTRQHPMWEEMIQLLGEYPPLKDRVRDLELNEKFRLMFGTEWCKNVGVTFNIEQPAEASPPNTPDIRSLGDSVAPEKESVSTPPQNPPKNGRPAAVLRIVA